MICCLAFILIVLLRSLLLSHHRDRWDNMCDVVRTVPNRDNGGECVTNPSTMNGTVMVRIDTSEEDSASSTSTSTIWQWNTRNRSNGDGS